MTQEAADTHWVESKWISLMISHAHSLHDYFEAKKKQNGFLKKMSQSWFRLPLQFNSSGLFKLQDQGGFVK